MIRVEDLNLKTSRVYRCIDDLDNFLIRIRLHNLSKPDQNDELKVFKWQEKCLGPAERQFFKDAKNCKTELQKTYNSLAKESDGILFSYVEADHYLPDKEMQQSSLVKLMSKLNVKQSEETAYDYQKYLKQSIGSPVTEDEFETMSIMADFGDFYQNTWIKHEHTLCVLKYNHLKQVLIIWPDFSYGKAYKLEIVSDESNFVEYFIENASLDKYTHQELIRESQLMSLVQNGVKLSLGQFEKPKSEDYKEVFVLIDVFKASGFENSNFFIKYFLDFPSEGNWQCLSAQRGTSMSCLQSPNAHFGFSFEFYLRIPNEFSLCEETKAPILYFEVISKDTWCRFRTEGLTFLVLPMRKAGRSLHKLNCVRLISGNLFGNLRRHFIGDSSNYSDISALGNTKQRFLNRLPLQTVSSGCIELCTNVVFQSGSKVSNEDDQSILKRKLNKQSESLTKNVEQVVEAFEKAQKAMQLARNQL